MCQQPSLPPPSVQTRPIQSGVTLNNQATQPTGPTLTRKGPHPAFGSPHRYLGSGCPHVCARTGTLSGPSGLCIFVLLDGKHASISKIFFSPTLVHGTNILENVVCSKSAISAPLAKCAEMWDPQRIVCQQCCVYTTELVRHFFFRVKESWIIFTQDPNSIQGCVLFLCGCYTGLGD